MKKKRYKILSILLSIMVMLSAIFMPSTKVMADTEDIKDIATGLIYTLDSNNKATITDYSGSSKVVNIPSQIGTGNYSVISIFDAAFQDHTELTDVSIPNSVTSIGGGAFYNCTGLTDISIPNSVTSIGDSAFYYCTGLTSIKISDNLTSIGPRAFYFCNNLKSITIPDGVTSIGQSTFANCYKLSNVTIPDSVTSIGDSAFGLCGELTSVTIPDSVTTIGMNAFSNCSKLTSLTIENSLVNILSNAFNGVSSLTKTGITIYKNPNDNRDLMDIGGYSGIVLNSTIAVSIAPINNGNATVNDYTNAEITGVTADNISAINSAVASAKTDAGKNLTKSQIQKAVNTVPYELKLTQSANILTAQLKKSDGTDFTTSVVTYEWYRGDTKISGQTQTYVLTSDDKGASIKAKVTEYSLKSNSIYLPGPPSVITGTVSSVTTDAAIIIGTVNPNGADTTVTFEYGTTTPGDKSVVASPNLVSRSGGTSVSGTLSGLTPKALYYFRVVGSNSEGTSYGLYETFTTASINSSPVTPPPAVIIPSDDETTTSAAVTIKGTTRVGKTLEAVLLTESGAEFTTSAGVTYEWYRLSSKDSNDGIPVGNNSTYRLVPSDKGKYIKLIVYCDDEKIGSAITGIITRKSESGSSSSSSSSSDSKASGENTATNNETLPIATINSNVLKEGWNQTSGVWKYIKNGQPVNGWNLIDGSWYFMDPIGVMQTSWQKLDKEWYFLKDSGAMAIGWQQLNGTWYFLTGNGVMATGWQEINGIWYYFYSDGSMAFNTIIDSCNLDESGAWIE